MADTIENITNPTQTAPEQDPAPEKTFTQAEVDNMIARRIARATKGMPSEEELTAYRTWKESQQSEKERFDNAVRERDESKTALASALAEVEQYKREKQLMLKGVPAEDVDYYAYKISKLITDDLPFEKAADQFLQSRTTSSAVKVDFSAPLSGGSKQAPTLNETMNDLLRGWRR